MVWSFLSTTVQLHATHRKGGRRRKRHSTSTHEWGQQQFRPRLLRVTGRARRVALIKQAPPPLHPRTPHGQNMWFSGFSAKSEDGLYLEAQKFCSWIRTAFVIMYEFEWQVVPEQQAGTVRQRRRPYKLSGSESRSHLRTAWDWEGVRSWRFCRAQIVRVWMPTFAGACIFYWPRRFQRPPCYCRILWDANILDEAQIFYICADIWIDASVMGANISWAQIFHGRKYFMGANISIGANISWAQIFHWRKYFEVCIYFWLEANILCVNYYLRQAPIFNDFCSQFCQFYFCNKFLLWFCC